MTISKVYKLTFNKIIKASAMFCHHKNKTTETKPRFFRHYKKRFQRKRSLIAKIHKINKE